MPASSFISDLTAEVLCWPQSSDTKSPLVLAQCQFSIEAYQDDDFDRFDVYFPPRLQRAVTKRRSEFLAGRVCAQHSLGQLEISGTVGSADKRRDPLWPQGSTGAITHSHGLAAALTGPTDHWQGLGLDIEHWIEPSSARHLASAILQPHEIALLEDDDSNFAHQLTLIFSAKETLFKALNPLTGTSFYFHDASLLELDKQTLTLRLNCSLNEHWQKGTALTCHYANHPTHVMTWLAIPT